MLGRITRIISNDGMYSSEDHGILALPYGVQVVFAEEAAVLLSQPALTVMVLFHWNFGVKRWNESLEYSRSHIAIDWI